MSERGESQFPTQQTEIARESREISRVRRTRLRPWAWNALGAALFLPASPLIIWGISLNAVDGGRAFLVASWLACAAASALLIQRPWRLPEALTLRSTALVLIVMYCIPIMGFTLTEIEYAAGFLCLGLLFQAGWTFIGHELRLLPGAIRVVVFPGGRSLGVTQRHSRSVEWIIPTDIEALQRVDGVLLDPDVPLEPPRVRLLNRELRGVRLYLADTIIEDELGRVPLDHVPVNSAATFRPRPSFDRAQRVLDIVILLVTLPLTVPAFLLTALCVLTDSGGPLLFRQARVGKNGRHLQILKFRSLRADSGAGALSMLDDARVTRIGRFLRETHLDELPQLWNVLRGDMSIVGPRPEQVRLAEKFNAEIRSYGYRHLIRPGITGWAQINQNHAESLQFTRVKLEHDLYYAKHSSVLLDLVILFRTIPRVLRDAMGGS